MLAGPAAADGTYAAEENSFVAKINAERRSRGLGGLTQNLQLTGVARGWSVVMEREDRMYHNPSLASAVDGGWTRLGENVGYTIKTDAGLAELVDRLHVAFMNSPGHRANVLGDFNQVGVGVRVTGAGKMWVTVNFSKDRSVVSNGTVFEAGRVAGRVFAGAHTDGRRAKYVVVTASNAPANALGAAALAGDQGPLLYTHPARPNDKNPVLHPSTRAVIDRVLGGSGKVYVIGSRKHVSDRAVRELVADGYSVKRLNGRGRAARLAAVARETVRQRGDNGKALIVSANWTSSVAGAVWAAKTGTPVLVTSRTRLHPAVRDFLATHRPARRYVVGGADSVSAGVVRAARAQRIGGHDRADVAVNVARRLWGRTAASDGDRWASTPGFDRKGWAYTLAYAPWSAAYDGPALLVGTSAVPRTVNRYLAGLRYGGSVKGRVQAATTVPRKVVNRVESLVAAP